MKVLFATDGSPNAMDAARYLTKLEISKPLDITLLTVSYNPRTASPKASQPWFSEWLEAESKRVDADHEKLEALFSKRGATVRRSRRDGRVAAEILKQAKADDVDLIVIGARGHTLIGRLVLGSVSDDVATHAECSVLVIRPGEKEPSELKRIMIAYDGSTPSREAIDEVLDLDWKSDTELTLVSIAPLDEFIQGDGYSAAAIEHQSEVFEHLKEAGKKISEEITSRLPNTHSLVDQRSHAGDAIVMVAERNISDLIVIGDAGHNFLHDMLLGSTTKYVLRHAPCSVWISRRHRQPESVAKRDSQKNAAI